MCYQDQLVDTLERIGFDSSRKCPVPLTPPKQQLQNTRPVLNGTLVFLLRTSKSQVDQQ